MAPFTRSRVRVQPRWTALPDPLLHEVMSWLPVKDLCRLLAACRSLWRLRHSQLKWATGFAGWLSKPPAYLLGMDELNQCLLSVVKAMQTHRDNLELQTKALEALSTQCSRVHLDLPRALEVLSEVIAAIQAHMRGGELVMTAGCSALAGLCRACEPIHRTLVAPLVIPVLLAALHTGTESMVLAALGGLQQVVVIAGALAQLMVDAGGLAAVMATLRRFEGEFEVAKGASFLLFELCSLEERRSVAWRQAVVDAGVIELLAKTVGERSAVFLCELLGVLCHGDDEASGLRKQAAVDAGAIEIFKQTLSTSKECGYVVDICARALACVCEGQGEGRFHRVRAAVNAGVFELVVQLMREQKWEPSALQGCIVLIDRLCRDDCWLDAIERNVLVAVAAALRTGATRGIEELVHGCLAVLRLGLDWPQWCRAAAAAGSIDAGVVALRAPWLSARSFCEVCTVLTALVRCCSRRYAPMAADAGAVAALVGGLVGWRRSPAPVEEACWALTAVCRGGYKRALAEAGAMEAALAALETHPRRAAVQEAGWSLVAAMCRGGEPDEVEQQRRWVTAARVVAAMQAHVGDEGVQSAGCSVLRHLCGSEELAARLASEAGVAAAVVAALRAHPSELLLQRRGCFALGVLLRGASLASVAAAADAGAIGAVLAALRSHSDDAKLSQGAAQALRSLLRAGLVLSSDAVA